MRAFGNATWVECHEESEKCPGVSRCMESGRSDCGLRWCGSLLHDDDDEEDAEKTVCKSFAEWVSVKAVLVCSGLSLCDVWHRSSRHLCTYRQDWAVWRLCSCYYTTERHETRQPRTSTLHCTLPSRRATKTSSRYFLTVEPNTTPSRGYHLFAFLAVPANCHPVSFFWSGVHF